MAASLSAAIKAFLETQSLGLSFYKDVAPQQAKRPYGIVIEGIAMRPDGMEDGTVLTALELVQLDLWQDWLKADKTVNEDVALADKITSAIHGTRLLASGTGAPPKQVYGVAQQGRVRILDRNNGLVQYSYTLAVYRSV